MLALCDSVVVISGVARALLWGGRIFFLLFNFHKKMLIYGLFLDWTSLKIVILNGIKC